MVPRDEQMKRLSASRNCQVDYAQWFALFTVNEDGKQTFRMESTDAEYLRNTGEKWVQGKLAHSYKVSAYSSGG